MTLKSRAEQPKRFGGEHGVTGLLLIIVLAGITLCTACSSSSGQADKKGEAKQKQGIGTPFSGANFEASGVAYVPGGEGVLFVDDSRPEEVFWMKLDQAGQQLGDIKPVKLGAFVDNPEGITFDGSYFYVVSSQSNPDGGERNAIARFVFDHTTESIRNTSVIGNLRDWLLTRVTDLKGAGQMKGSQGGLNIEGVAWDPGRKRLLLGLRSPIMSERALIVPIKLINPDGPFSADNMQLEDSRAIQVPLGGSGIRDIQYDSRLKSFLLISGAPENEQKRNFILWRWSGNSGDSQPIQKSALDQRLKPEGVTSVAVGGNDFVFIVCDASRYIKIGYSELE